MFHFLSSYSYKTDVTWSEARLAHLVSSLPLFWQMFFGDLFTTVESCSIPYKYLSQDTYAGLDVSSPAFLGVGAKTCFPQPHANLSGMQTQRRQQCSRSMFLTNNGVFTGSAQLKILKCGEKKTQMLAVIHHRFIWFPPYSQTGIFRPITIPAWNLKGLNHMGNNTALKIKPNFCWVSSATENISQKRLKTVKVMQGCTNITTGL